MNEYKKVRLGDVCEKGSSNIAQNEILENEGNYPIYGAAGFIKNVDFYKQEEPYIGIVKDGAGVGRVSVHPAKSSLIGTMQYIFPKENIEIGYLAAYLKSQNLGSLYKGAAIPHIYFKDYENFQIPLPPKETQKQIASSLDKITKIITENKTLLEKYDLLIKSRFIEMFGDPVENPKQWNIEKLKSLTSKIGSGATPKGGRESYISEGISLVRSMNVYKGFFEYEGLAHITEAQAKELDNVTLQENDVLLNITGASVARCCILPKDVLPARVNQHVSILRTTEKINPVYLSNLLISDTEQRVLLGIGGAGGATREAITKTELESLDIPVPPLELQQQFATFVQQIDKSKFENNYKELVA